MKQCYIFFIQPILSRIDRPASKFIFALIDNIVSEGTHVFYCIHAPLQFILRASLLYVIVFWTLGVRRAFLYRVSTSDINRPRKFTTISALG